MDLGKRIWARHNRMRTVTMNRLTETRTAGFLRATALGHPLVASFQARGMTPEAAGNSAHFVYHAGTDAPRTSTPGAYAASAAGAGRGVRMGAAPQGSVQRSQERVTVRTSSRTTARTNATVTGRAAEQVIDRAFGGPSARATEGPSGVHPGNNTIARSPGEAPTRDGPVRRAGDPSAQSTPTRGAIAHDEESARSGPGVTPGAEPSREQTIRHAGTHVARGADFGRQLGPRMTHSTTGGLGAAWPTSPVHVQRQISGKARPQGSADVAPAIDRSGAQAAQSRQEFRSAATPGRPAIPLIRRYALGRSTGKLAARVVQRVARPTGRHTANGVNGPTRMAPLPSGAWFPRQAETAVHAQPHVRARVQRVEDDGAGAGFGPINSAAAAHTGVLTAGAAAFGTGGLAAGASGYPSFQGVWAAPGGTASVVTGRGLSVTQGVNTVQRPPMQSSAQGSPVISGGSVPQHSLQRAVDLGEAELDVPAEFESSAMVSTDSMDLDAVTDAVWRRLQRRQTLEAEREGRFPWSTS